MEFDLCTITWEAIGSIITGIGLFLAYWSIYKSNKQNKKNRDLEIRLRQQENEQKWLDDYVQTVHKMFAVIRKKEIVEYVNTLCCTDSYTIQDIRYFTNLSLKFNEFFQEICLKKNKVTSNKNTILIHDYLEKININLIGLHFKFCLLESENLYDDETFSLLIEEIMDLNGGKLPDHYPEYIFYCDVSKFNLKRLLYVYSELLMQKISLLQFEVINNLGQYMKNEQERIDNLLTDD